MVNNGNWILPVCVPGGEPSKAIQSALSCLVLMPGPDATTQPVKPVWVTSSTQPTAASWIRALWMVIWTWTSLLVNGLGKVNVVHFKVLLSMGKDSRPNWRDCWPAIDREKETLIVTGHSSKYKFSLLIVRDFFYLCPENLVQHHDNNIPYSTRKKQSQLVIDYSCLKMFSSWSHSNSTRL